MHKIISQWFGKRKKDEGEIVEYYHKTVGINQITRRFVRDIIYSAKKRRVLK